VSRLLGCWRVPIAAVMLAAAALLALEAHALLAARTANERDAVRGLMALTSDQPMSGTSAAIGARERALLGLEGVPALHRALDELARSRTAKRGKDAKRALLEAQRRLGAVVQGRAPATMRSQAANLLGALLLIEGLTEQKQDKITKATTLFRRAVVLGPENESAKFNLELALSIPGNSGERSRSKSNNPGPGGVGYDPPGSGY
jgi:hypothetical protein